MVSNNSFYWPKKRNIFGVEVSVTCYQEVVDTVIAAAQSGRGGVATFLAVHGIVSAATDPEFGRRVNACQIVGPDGQPVRWALNFFHKAGAVPVSVTSTVPSALSVSVGNTAPNFGAFTPGQAGTYTSTLGATVTTTAASSVITASDTCSPAATCFPGRSGNRTASCWPRPQPVPGQPSHRRCSSVPRGSNQAPR